MVEMIKESESFISDMNVDFFFINILAVVGSSVDCWILQLSNATGDCSAIDCALSIWNGANRSGSLCCNISDADGLNSGSNCSMSRTSSFNNGE